MSNDQVLDSLAVLSNKDIRKIQKMFTLQHCDKSALIAWGYCTYQKQTIVLQCVDYLCPPLLKNRSDEIHQIISLSENHDLQHDYFHSLLSKLDIPTPNSVVDYAITYNQNGEHFGLVFVVHRSAPQAKNLLNALATEIEDLIAHKQLSFSVTELKRSFQEQIEQRNHQITALKQKVDHLESENAHLERQLLYRQHHDPATKMLNRVGLENALAASFNSRTIIDGNAYLSVIFVQITNGERIQARLGCDRFDALLSLFRDKINQHVPHIHYYARISTTELALATVVPSFDDQFLPNLCRQLSYIARQGIVYQQQEAHLHVFMGVANSYNTDNATQLINNAFQAAICCKESGASVSIFTQADQDEQKEFNQLEHYLLQAVRNDDLMLHFQPKVDLQNKRWMGAEVLLRWNHPVLGDVSNEALIHMAEQNGLIVEVGYFVLRNAIDMASEWADIAPDFILSVNVSGKQICTADFAEKVLDMLIHNELPAANLELELTESCLVTNFDVAYQNINRLKKHGVQFALDDFGTGYASFNYLRKLPFDSIKIDKEFLANILQNAQDKAILRSIINIAKKLNKQVVVEGVETPEQHLFVSGEGCDQGQGYYYAKPMPRDIFESQLEKQYPLSKQFIIR